MEAVIEALSVLCSSSDPTSRQNADVWLRDWQRSDQAWFNVDQILSVSNLSDEVYLFASQCLRKKVLYDMYEIRQDGDVEALTNKILGHIMNFSPKLKIANMLCLCAADLAVYRFEHWKDPIGDLVGVFLKSLHIPPVHSKRLLIQIIQYIYEEAKSRLLISRETKLKLLDYCDSYIGKVRIILEYSFKWNKNPDENPLEIFCSSQKTDMFFLSKSVLDCWASVIGFFKPKKYYHVDSSFFHLITQAFFNGGLILSWNDEVRETCANLVIDSFVQLSRVCGNLEKRNFSFDSDTLEEGEIMNLIDVLGCNDEERRNMKQLFLSSFLIRNEPLKIRQNIHIIAELFLSQNDMSLFRKISNNYKSIYKMLKQKKIETILSGMKNVTNDRNPDDLIEGLSDLDDQLLSKFSRMYSEIGVEYIPNIINEGIIDTKTVSCRILSELLGLIELPYSLSCGTLSGRPVYFFSKLIQQLESALKFDTTQQSIMSQPSKNTAGTSTLVPNLPNAPNSADDNLVFLKEFLFAKLLPIVIDQCIPYTFEAPDCDFSDHRALYVELLDDLATIISPNIIVNKILESLYGSNCLNVSGLPLQWVQVILEAHLYAITPIIDKVESDANLCPTVYTLIEGVLLNRTWESSDSEMSVCLRLRCVEFLAVSQLWIKNHPQWTNRILEMLLEQATTTRSTIDSRFEKKSVHKSLSHLRLRSAQEFAALCFELPHYVDLSAFLTKVAKLEELKPATAGNEFEDVSYSVYQGLSYACAQITTEEAFLKSFNILLTPSFEVIDNKNITDAGIVSIGLNQLAVVLKAYEAGIKKNKLFVVEISKIICDVIYIKLVGNIEKFIYNVRINEFAIRGLKHAFRIAGSTLKVKLPELVYFLQRASELCLHSPHLYCAEYLISEFLDDRDALPFLQSIFNDLSNKGLAMLEKEEHYNKCSHMIEDIFGMFLRYLHYKPFIPFASGNLIRGFALAQKCIFVEHPKALSVVFSFLCLVVTSHRFIYSIGVSDASDIESEIAKQIPVLIQQIFSLLLTGPNATVVDHITQLIHIINNEVADGPDKAPELLYHDAFNRLPPSILQTESIKNRLLKDTSCDGFSRIFTSVSELASRCNQYVLRFQRS